MSTECMNATLTELGEQVVATRPAREWLHVWRYVGTEHGMPTVLLARFAEGLVADVQGAGVFVVLETEADRLFAEACMARPAERWTTGDGGDLLTLPLARLSERPSSSALGGPIRLYLYSPPVGAPGSVPYLAVVVMPHATPGALRGRYTLTTHSTAQDAAQALARHADTVCRAAMRAGDGDHGAAQRRTLLH
ncbi:MAG TPA: hypothetical protein VD860_08650 [Azospirillum sp.]|nr:hypothetical protein [Azospirillum sp.]